ncbi:MAG: bifunctional precorrin-2 dehydrogenase/sirohydrochlorin ferrochelatase [Actinomycetota bacterium]
MGRDLYPVFLDLHDRLVVVVGGGQVATDRAAKLVAHGARVRVVSPALGEAMASMVADGRVAEHRARGYEAGDLDGAVLVVAATDDEGVNRRVRDDARALGALANVADDPEGSSAVIPALMREGDLAIAITTGGASPVVSRRIREDLQQRFGPGWAGLIALLADTRDDLIAAHPDIASRRAAVEGLIDSGIVDDIAAEGPEACRARVRAALGLDATAVEAA